MKGNSHFDLAQTAYTRSLSDHAQVQATLALAYEQRTANLLTMLNHATDQELAEHLVSEILPRVGMEYLLDSELGGFDQ